MPHTDLHALHMSHRVETTAKKKARTMQPQIHVLWNHRNPTTWSCWNSMLKQMHSQSLAWTCIEGKRCERMQTNPVNAASLLLEPNGLLPQIQFFRQTAKIISKSFLLSTCRNKEEHVQEIERKSLEILDVRFTNAYLFLPSYILYLVSHAWKKNNSTDKWPRPNLPRRKQKRRPQCLVSYHLHPLLPP